MKAMTSKIAWQLVLRIEALNAEIEKVYEEARAFDGTNNDAVIADAVAARKAQRDAGQSAAALLGSFDFSDSGERVAPTGKSAWGAVSSQMMEGLAALPPSKTRDHLLKQMAIIDKLEALAIENGLPIITEEQLDTYASR